MRACVSVCVCIYTGMQKLDIEVNSMSVLVYVCVLACMRV